MKVYPLGLTRKSLRDNSNTIFAVVSDVFILSYTRTKAAHLL